jgi:hypothetical protein
MNDLLLLPTITVKADAQDEKTGEAAVLKQIHHDLIKTQVIFKRNTTICQCSHT